MAISHAFNTREQLAVALAHAVANNLATGIAQRGRAALVVSGGSTPKRFFSHLAAHEDVDWQHVVITLVDERWVDEASDRSNARLVNDHLLQGPAKLARFVPLYTGDASPDLMAIAMAAVLQKTVPHPFDAVVLGMGNDGHTASFFPDADTLQEALSSADPVLAINAPGLDEPRITMTLPHLLATSALYLHIEGAEKSTTLARAKDTDGSILDMPVRAVLRQTTTELNIYSCA